MNKQIELARNSIIITIGKISTQFLSFLLLPLYTALLSKNEYGVVDLVNTYVQLAIPVVIMQMDQALLRYMIQVRDSTEEIKKCLSTVFILFIIQALTFSILSLIASGFINSQYMLLFYANVIALVFSSYALQLARGFGDTVSYSISSFLCGALTVICNVLFITVWHMKAEGMLLATFIGNIVSGIYVIFREKIWKYLHVNHFDSVLLKKMLQYAWPLIPNALIWWIVNASDRSIVLMFLGTSANGILAVSHKFPTLLMTAYNIFHISWTESAALHLDENDKDAFFSKVYNSIIRLFVAAASLLIGIMPFIFNILVNSEYKEAYYQIPIFTMASLFNIIVGLYSVIYISNMKTGEIAKTSLLSGLINILVHLLLIKRIGLYAASVSSTVAFGLMAVYRIIDGKKYINRTINIKLLFFSTIVFIVGFIGYYLHNYIYNVLYLVASIVFSILVNKGNISSARSFVLSKKRSLDKKH